MTHFFSLVWTQLAWWQLILLAVYTIYFIVRTYAFWGETHQRGLIKGYKEVMFDDDTHFRVYHIILIIFDIPPATIGLFFPLLRYILRFEICKLKKEA